MHALPPSLAPQGVWAAIKQQVAEKGATQFYGALLRCAPRPPPPSSLACACSPSDKVLCRFLAPPLCPCTDQRQHHRTHIIS